MSFQLKTMRELNSNFEVQSISRQAQEILEAGGGEVLREPHCPTRVILPEGCTLSDLGLTAEPGVNNYYAGGRMRFGPRVREVIG